MALPDTGPRETQAACSALVGQCIGQVASRDEDAFGVLWRDLQSALLRYLTVMTPQAAVELASGPELPVVPRRGSGAPSSLPKL